MKIESIVKVHLLAKPYVLKGIKNHLKMILRVDTGSFKQPDSSESERTPFDLVIVLDKSGSMNGDPFNNSKVAIIRIIKSMTENDTLGLVAYDDSVEVVFKNGTKKMADFLIEQVKKLRTGGCTNIWSGLEAAAKILEKSESKQKRIMLFSDGLVNSGLQDKDLICKKVGELHKNHGLNVSCYGIGSDYDEPLMRNICEYGHGTYYFIDGAKDIEKKIQSGMNVITSLLGKNTVVKIRGKNGCTITKVHGYSSEDLLKGIELGDICENDSLSVAFETEIVATDGENNDEFIAYEITFNEILNANEVKIEGAVKVEITEDEKKALLENEECESAFAVTQAGHDDLRVLAFLNRNKFDDAIELKKKTILNLEKYKDVDKTGLVKLILERNIEMLEKLKKTKKNKSQVESVKKDVSFQSFQSFSPKKNYFL